MGFPMMHGAHHEKQWGEPYVRTYHGDGTRVVAVHMWPMMILAWLLFALGVMVGTKRTMMMQRMGGGHGMGMGMGMGPCKPWMGGMGMGGMGMGAKPWMGGMGMGGKPWMAGKGMGEECPPWMMHHHHHGHGKSECCKPHDNGEKTTEAMPEQTEGGAGI
jgi:hypothetical protein